MSSLLPPPSLIVRERIIMFIIIIVHSLTYHNIETKVQETLPHLPPLLTPGSPDDHKLLYQPPRYLSPPEGSPPRWGPGGRGWRRWHSSACRASSGSTDWALGLTDWTAGAGWRRGRAGSRDGPPGSSGTATSRQRILESTRERILESTRQRILESTRERILESTILVGEY